MMRTILALAFLVLFAATPARSSVAPPAAAAPESAPEYFILVPASALADLDALLTRTEQLLQDQQAEIARLRARLEKGGCI